MDTRAPNKNRRDLCDMLCDRGVPYGEVPIAFWPMDELSPLVQPEQADAYPKADAFVLADSAGDGFVGGQMAESAASYREPFMPCEHFAGYRVGIARATPSTRTRTTARATFSTLRLRPSPR